MNKTKRERARELALKFNEIIIDSDEEITTDVLLCACARLIGSAAACAGETERDVVNDMVVFGDEVQSNYRACRQHLTRH